MTTKSKPDWLTNALMLAREADCASPDSDSSAGARFLLSVAVDAWERCEYNESPIDDDDIAEVAEGAPDLMTHTRWQEFVDLAAYQEDVRDMIDGMDDMTAMAAVALHEIAERLARRVAEAYAIAEEEEEEEEEEE